MKYLIWGMYSFAVSWLIISSCNFYMNYKRLREIDREILIRKAKSDIWKTELKILEIRGMKDEDSVDSVGYNDER